MLCEFSFVIRVIQDDFDVICLLAWRKISPIPYLRRNILGDYRNSARRPNAQKSQIFDLVKSDALPHFLARPGQIEKKSRQKGGVSGHPHFLPRSHLARIWPEFVITHKKEQNWREKEGA